MSQTSFKEDFEIYEFIETLINTRDEDYLDDIIRMLDGEYEKLLRSIKDA